MFNSCWGPSLYRRVICCLPAYAGLGARLCLGRVIDYSLFGVAAGQAPAAGASSRWPARAERRQARRSLATNPKCPWPPGAASTRRRCPGEPGWRGSGLPPPPHLNGNQGKSEQLFVPIDLFFYFAPPAPSCNIVSETSLLGSGAGRLEPPVNCSVRRSVLWQGSPPPSPTCTVLMDLSFPPRRQMRRRYPTGFTSGQAGGVLGERGKPPCTPGARREAGISYELFW